MKITKIYEKLYKIEADEGKQFISSDKTIVYSTLMYTPIDTPNVLEVSKEEAEKLQKELEEKYKTYEV